MKRRGFLGLFGASLLAPFVPLAPVEIATDVASGTTTITSFDALMKARYMDSGIVKQLVYNDSVFFSLLPKGKAFE